MRNLRRIGLVLILVSAMSSTLCAQDPSVLLEKAIYTEETLGNLSEAIGIYQQVVANTEAGRSTAALALYRLGMCYQKSGRTTDAQAAFVKLAKLYPEQQELISKIPGTSSDSLGLRPAPWVDGETLQLSLKVNMNAVKGPDKTGTQTFRVESGQVNGKAIWRIHTLVEQGSMGIVQFSTVDVDASRLTPISGSFKSPFMGMRYLLNYAQDQVEQSNIKKDGTIAKTRIPLDRTVYDYSEVEMLLRCLPLREGFQITLPMMSPSATLIFDVKISVQSREKITVPAGTFDCYKAAVNQAGQERVYWISADDKAYLVKSNQSDLITLELESIKRAGKSQPATFEDRERGITISAPPEWYISDSSMPPGIHLIEPESEADGMLRALPDGNEAPASLDEAVNKYFAGMQKARPGYNVRMGSRSAITISGLPAIRYIADCKHIITGQDMVEYVDFFAKSGKTFALVLQVGAGAFDSMRPAFDSIASGIVVQ